ncbi:MAG TPA: cytochrome c3 family protein [Chloroflexi bacterium]|nr:cytochrome c3 family protein [Chloroflexota bacterium]HPO58044.1 cytochrome c3 family protein [Anaerolineaceae bacterium]
MTRPKPWYKHGGIITGIVLLLLILIGGAAAALVFTQQSPDQPIQFPHRTHVLIGAQCQYCHPAVAFSAEAGLPSTDKCWGCHQQIERQSEQLDILASYVESGEPIPWVPVALLPDFIHFNHLTHVDSGIACETCHGDVSQMTVAEPQTRWNMGWCLECHSRTGEENFVRLSDCATCHY